MFNMGCCRAWLRLFCSCCSFFPFLSFVYSVILVLETSLMRSILSFRLSCSCPRHVFPFLMYALSWSLQTQPLCLAHDFCHDTFSITTKIHSSFCFLLLSFEHFDVFANATLWLMSTTCVVIVCRVLFTSTTGSVYVRHVLPLAIFSLHFDFISGTKESWLPPCMRTMQE